MKYSALKNFINGELVIFDGGFSDVQSPLNGNIISTVPISNADAVNRAVLAAQKAFSSWSTFPIKERAKVFYRYRGLLEKNMNELAELIQEENGKTISESIAEIEKSIEITEFACSLPQIVTGEVLEVSKGVECRVENSPLGVVASITPFNFPNMVPNWTIPIALMLGNCMILKPSELVPLSANRIAVLLKE
jgi:malonate-semialdehyde dehydrogenase (acetylating)/methylmalonate-semialdehyde dehydrogenase